MFTHDDRLPEAVRRLDIDARIINVHRRASSKVEVVAGRPPSDRYVGEAFAFAKTEDVSDEVRARVVPGLCRSAIEAACAARIRRRLIDSGTPHARVEELLAEKTSLNSWLAGAFELSTAQGIEITDRVRQLGGEDAVTTVATVKRGSHRLLAVDGWTLAEGTEGARPSTGAGVLTPRDLLAEARRMLDEPSPGTAAIWPRAAALLARQAIEESLESYWAVRAPGVQRLNMRAQLGCLGVYLEPASLAHEVAFTWHALSRSDAPPPVRPRPDPRRARESADHDPTTHG